MFFDELGLPRPDHRLGVGGGTNTSQTARMLAALEPLLAAERPDVVLVYGDTNSTLAGAVAGAQAGVPVAHVEAGMRSYDRTMPEELNRVLADHAAALLLCSSERAAETLRLERVAGEVVVVGDVMVDVAHLLAPRARARTAALEAWGVDSGGYLLVTAHRAGNVDDPARLARLVELLLAVPGPVVLPLHPRTRARLEAAALLGAARRARAAHSAARLSRLHGAAPARAGGADRLRRRAEGGLPRRRAVPDAAARHRVDGDRRRRAGTPWSTSTRTPPWPRSSARCRPNGRRSTATVARASGWWRRCGRRYSRGRERAPVAARAPARSRRRRGTRPRRRRAPEGRRSRRSGRPTWRAVTCSRAGGRASARR